MIAREKIAVIAITKHGAALAERLYQSLDKSDLFIAAKFKKEIPEHSGKITFTAEPIKVVTGSIFSTYDALIYVVSLGAVVRTIAPFLKDKNSDPAVLVIDDNANFVISVLSGHVGGANELTDEIAKLLGAQSVVTTASDVGKTIPVDILGREFGWTLDSKENVTKVSASVVNQEPIGFYQEAGEPGWWKRETPLPANIRLCRSFEELDDPAFKAVLLVTDKQLPENWPLRSKAVVYRPKSLVLGMGCDKGASLQDIEEFVFKTLTVHGLSGKCLKAVSSVDLKAEEPGLKEFALKHGLPLHCFTREDINQVKDLPNPSAMAMKHIGAIGVAEPSALLCSGAEALLVPKVKTARVTLAIARMNFKSGETPAKSLTAVGGPHV